MHKTSQIDLGSRHCENIGFLKGRSLWPSGRCFELCFDDFAQRHPLLVLLLDALVRESALMLSRNDSFPPELSFLDRLHRSKPTRYHPSEDKEGVFRVSDGCCNLF
jgi:hypothetical protein